MKLSILFTLFTSVLFSQLTITGKIVDKTTHEGIPYASIGIKGKAIGTLSDEYGVFKLELKNIPDTDSLNVTAIGYHSQRFIMSDAKSFSGKTVSLTQSAYGLNEVVVKPTKTIKKTLGNRVYNKNIHCSFTGNDSNFVGVQAAIKAGNRKGREVWFEEFNFCLLKNTIEDTIVFRLNFYKEDADGDPGENILSKPIIFKACKQKGILSLDLKPYNIHYNNDFFISLECLSKKVNKDNLTFSGSLIGPAWFKPGSHTMWHRQPVMGLDFNVVVTFQK